MNWPEHHQPCFSTEQLEPTINIAEQLDQPTDSALDCIPIRDPGLAAVLDVLAPNHPKFANRHTYLSQTDFPKSGHMDTTVEEPCIKSKEVKSPTIGIEPLPKPIERHDSGNTILDGDTQLSPRDLAATARSVIARSEQQSAEEDLDPLTKNAPNASREQLSLRPASSTVTRPPTKVHTVTAPADPSQSSASIIDTLAASPGVGKHTIHADRASANTLAAVCCQSAQDQAKSLSPRKDRLPSFSQFTGHLDQLAEVAAASEPQHPFTHRHTQSFGSATSPSPVLSYHAPGLQGLPSAQTSPISHYTQSVRSPTSAVAEVSHPLYGSPRQYAVPTAYFTDRRPSAATEGVHLVCPPSLPSAGTSSGESHSHPNSSTDGYSTNHTTPIDQPLNTAGTQRPILPPPPGMPASAVMMTGFKCDYNGCSAPPFQTQYLLT